MNITKEGKIQKVVIYRDNGGWIPSFHVKYKDGKVRLHAIRRQIADEPRIWARADTLLLWIANNFGVYNAEIDMEGLKYE